MKDFYKRFFEMESEYVKRDVFMHSLNFRTSKSKNKLLEEEIKNLKEIGIKLSKNDLINLCIDVALGYKQSKDTPDKFFRSKSYMTLQNYVNENKPELIESVKVRLFMKQCEQMNPEKPKKVKKHIQIPNE